MADSGPGAGALLLIEIVEATWSAALGQTIARFRPAGLAFWKLSSPAATLEACRESGHALDAVPLIAIEEEGDGALTTILPAFPRALTLEAADAAAAGDLIGRAMAAFGLNLNLAPTLDIDVPAAGSSANALPGAAALERVSPVDITRRADAFVGALKRHRVLCCGRHFPGLPARKAAPQRAKTIVVDRSLAALWREELVPYRTLGDKLAAVEISHAVHRAYDYEFLQPASLSPGVIDGLLRTKLRYQGLALANASLAAQAAGVDVDEAAIRALVAGCDLVLVPGEPKLVEGICQSLGRAAESGRLTSARLSEAMSRVKTARKSLPRAPRHLASSQYSRLERDWEQFAQKWTGRRNA
jgi:beta-N-acetylhexosaminidase